MAEKIYSYTLSNEKVIEKVVEDENVGLNHMVLPPQTGLPVHNANSNVYMIVARGAVTAVLDDGTAKTVTAGSILNIPYKTRMQITNEQEDTLELFVVKAPSPLFFGK